MTPDGVSVDHRRARAFAPGDLPAYLEASWDLMPQSSMYIADVYRLNDIGAVVAHVVHGTTAEGFTAEWREIIVLQGLGDRMSRCEMFDEEDFDAALARFDELQPQARQLENTATRTSDRYIEKQVARDWDAMAEMLADDFQADDRRPVVGGGVHGRDGEIANARASADVGVADLTATVIATRGERRSLSRYRYSFRDQGLETSVVEILVVGEINAEGRAAAAVAFDPDDIDAAVAELDARYLTGEAAPHSAGWSAVMQGFVALNRHERPLMTPDVVSVDHRRGRAFAPGDLPAFLDATWQLMPQAAFYIEVVHRLDDIGVVVAYVIHGTTAGGFGAEWRQIAALMITGDLVSHCEFFDEADLDAALARFDKLQPQTRRLENAASQVTERYWRHFSAREWDAMAELVAAMFRQMIAVGL